MAGFRPERQLPAFARGVALLLAVAIVGACGGGRPATGAGQSPSTSSASSSRQASPSPPTTTPVPVVGAYGVLVDFSGTGTYTVSLIGIDGKVTASAQASFPAGVLCSGTSTATVPSAPVSTSNTRIYFMDAEGVIRFLAPNGGTGLATTVPIGAARRSIFAVSPDDQRIAVAVADFTSNGTSTKLYVEDLNGGANHVDTFSETGSYTLWPVGWHGASNLVVAKVLACQPPCSSPFCGEPLELHVVDPSTAVRRFTIGGPTCRIAGPPSPAGAVCEDTTTWTQLNVLDWSAATQRTFSIEGSAYAYLSPDGSQVALVIAQGTAILGTKKLLPWGSCGWIDDEHLLGGSGVGNVTDGTSIQVAARGICGGRIPGGL
jgi:hypothetical protein